MPMPENWPPNPKKELLKSCKQGHPLTFGSRIPDENGKFPDFNVMCDVANNEPLFSKKNPEKEYWRCEN